MPQPRKDRDGHGETPADERICRSKVQQSPLVGLAIRSLRSDSRRDSCSVRRPWRRRTDGRHHRYNSAEQADHGRAGRTWYDTDRLRDLIWSGLRLPPHGSLVHFGQTRRSSPAWAREVAS